MYPPPSARFLPALAYSHQPVTTVQLDLTDGTSILLDHTGGSVTADRGQATRRTCSVTLADVSLIPRTPQDRLNVYGAVLRISRGIQFGTVAELAPLGMFRVDSVSGDVDVGPVTINGSGFEAFIQDDPFEVPTSVAAPTTAIGGITQLIQETLPDAVVVNQGTTDGTVGTMTWDAQSDRWAAVQELATALGAEVYADADGQFIIAPLPAVTGPNVVWTVAAGEGGVMIQADRGMDRSGVINSWTASGENATDNASPVSSTVEDTDPTSPTYVDGPFGRVRGFYSSATLTTTTACTTAATLQLQKSLLPNASADLTSLPNPLLEPGDVLRCVYADGTRELHQVQSLTISLDAASTMTVATIGGREDS